jgi:hypothetical protein
MDSGSPESWDRDQLRRQLQAMDDFDFEHLVADLWERQGWDAEVEQQSGDAGVDVRATKSSPYKQKALIQAKRYSEDNTLGGPDIQQYAALKQQEANVDKAIVITTGRFTGSAEDRAEDLNVKLIDGDDLINLIDEFDGYDIVDDYISTISAADEKNDNYDRDRDEQYFKPEVREELKETFGEDYQEHIQEQQYKATRAVEKTNAMVKINPHDAAQLGVFDGLAETDAERNWEENKSVLHLLKEDIHTDEEGEVFIEDLTDYVNPKAISSNHSENIAAIIERGISDDAWVKNSAGAKRFAKKAKQSDDSAGFGIGSDMLQSIAKGRDYFHYVAIGGLVITMLSFMLLAILVNPNDDVTAVTGVLTLLILTMPFIGVAGLVLDLVYINTEDSDWNPSLAINLVGALVGGILYAGYYVYKRQKHIGL